MTATVRRRVEEIESEVKDDAKDGEAEGQESVLLEQLLENKDQKEDELQALGSTGSIQGQSGAEESIPQEGVERSEISAARKESTEGCGNGDVLRDESQWQACEEAVVEDREEISEVQRRVKGPSSQCRGFPMIKAVTPKEEMFAKQEPSGEEELPITGLTVDETRHEHIPVVQTAV
ncbi:hypothetical protein N332_01730, partial [Mesitornis unicolor]